MIRIFQPTVGEDELAALAEVFDSSWLGKGPRADAFEQAFAGHLDVDAEQVASISSCTAGLFIAAKLADLGPDCEAVLPTVSYVAAGNAVAATGARPVFCDVDERTLNPTVDDVEAALTKRTRAVVLLHYGGYPGDVVEIARLCRERGILLIEDSACSVASRAGEQACGTVGDIGLWSFDSMKILVTGDGGMLWARDPEMVARARKLAYLGLEQFSGLSQAPLVDSRWWEFEVSSFSGRSVMNDMQAAMGLVQLPKVEAFVKRRRAVAEFYDRELVDLTGVRTPPPLPADHRSSYYLYWVQMEPEVRDRVAKTLLDRGIYTTFRYPALHRVRAYGSAASLPRAERAVDRTLCLPLHQALTDADVERIAAEFRNAVSSASANSR
ncbi:DegT/DnrJ/EryC1/StrS family aminotransferase [Amycolatopsis sp. lyj-109]|uniref:DegT/DnrJ/EryC1/StrS family aminotransferase n=1 Tax=Amycolatopsis sp. lyj-109 TaxID=2789287 RepID=UPI003977FE44